MTILVEAITEQDRADWLRMRKLLWPDGAHEHADEIERWYAGYVKEPQAVLIARIDGKTAGFVELSIRPYAEKCVTQNVAYLEGWFVLEIYRRRGAGRALIAAAKNWGREHGCREFASDAQHDNLHSISAHKACGFEDAGLVRCFRQDL